MAKNNDNYRVFPTSIAKVLSNKEAYTFLALLFKSDFITGESNVLLETLAAEMGYKSDTVSKHLHKAKKLKYLDIETKYHIDKKFGNPKRKNFYKVRIPKAQFIMVSHDFMELHFDNLTRKEESDMKGFILLIKCLCVNNCNRTFYSLRDMEKKLKLSYGTIQRLMKLCIEFELICKKGDAYEIMLKDFDIGNTMHFPKGTMKIYKEVYNSIYSFCQNRGIKAPPYHAKLIGQIAMVFHVEKNELKNLADTEFYKKYSIDYQLELRLPEIKEEIHSLNYFVKVLTNKNYKIPPVKHRDFKMIL